MNSKKSPIIHLIWEYFLIILGSNLLALGLVLFYIPNKISPGGVSAYSMIIHYLFGFPVGMVSLALNIPLFFLGLYFLGKVFGIRTVIGFSLSSIMIDIYAEFFKFPGLTDDIFLATIYGAVLIGSGLGMIFRVRATTGGTDILAQIFYHFFHIKPGHFFIVTDAVSAIAFAVMFKNPDLALYTMIGLFITGKIVNSFITGWNYAASAYIISNKIELIKIKIIHQLNRGGTSLRGNGIYTNQQREILYCVCSIKEVQKLKKIVAEVDPDAFVIINQVHEVLGEGFQNRA